jgi:tetratricopeptide (TPR) repeat protein
MRYARAKAAARALVAGLVVPLLATCGSAPPASNRVQQEAISANQRAARAYQQDRIEQARSLYEEALRLDLSIENADGAAVNLLSLARVEQAAGRADAAHGYLDRVLSGAPPGFAASRQAEASARKAQLYLAARELAHAASSAAQAEQLCQRSDCMALPAILNLRALAALRSGDAEGALRFSQRALAAADGKGARAERANGLRLAGEAHLARREPEPALQALGEALLLDQSLGESQRIFRDLMLLGEATEQQGRRDDARAYYQRALTVGAAGGDPAAQREARAQLDRM